MPYALCKKHEGGALENVIESTDESLTGLPESHLKGCESFVGQDQDGKPITVVRLTMVVDASGEVRKDNFGGEHLDLTPSVNKSHYKKNDGTFVNNTLTIELADGTKVPNCTMKWSLSSKVNASSGYNSM